MWLLGISALVCAGLTSTLCLAVTMDHTAKDTQRSIPAHVQTLAHTQTDPEAFQNPRNLLELVGNLQELGWKLHQDTDSNKPGDFKRFLHSDPTLDSTSRDDTSDSSSSSSSFDLTSFFNTPVASNLVTLISSAMKSRDQDIRDKEENNNNEDRNDTDDGAGDEVTTVMEGQRVEGEVQTLPSTSHTVEGEENFAPASPGLFGPLGTGSKLVDYLPDVSNYAIEAENLAPIAGASAVALLALGALFAVPVAPVILRRTGSNGWSGLPSLTSLFNWWSSPDPVAEAWADDYYKRYDHHQDHHYYDNTGYLEGQHYYSAYDSTGSSSHPGTLYQHESANPASRHQQQQQDSAAAAAPHEYVHPYHNDQDTPYQYQLPPRPQSQPPARRTPLRRPSVDGYEYVTLEQINRIGDDSVRLLGKLAQGYTAEDFYAYRDEGTTGTTTNNNLARRRLPVQHQQQQQHSRLHHYQYQPKPNYHMAQTYSRDTQQQHHQQEEHEESQHPYRDDTFSTTHEDEGDSDSEMPHPYRHKYNFGPSELSSDTDMDSQQSYHHEPVKVSDFPYEFHKVE